VTSSEVTGSLLILYDPRTTQLLRLLRRLIQTSGVHGVEVDEQDFDRASRPGDRLRRRLGEVDERVRHASRGMADLRVGIPSGLAALGVGKLLFGRMRIPEWYDLLFWSFVTFANLNPPAPHNPGLEGSGPDSRRRPAPENEE
jgi:hypothetical protein